MSNVEHPEHYNIQGRKECIVEMEERFGVVALCLFCILNVYKYLYRSGFKDDRIQDENKAIWYAKYAAGKLLKHKVSAVLTKMFFREAYYYLTTLK